MITSPMQPWLITLEAYRELCTVNFQAPAQGNAVDEKAQPYELKEGLATVRIHGTMLRQVSPRQKAIAVICGVRLCSMEETASALQQAAADPAVHTILLDIDSPGGTVNGTPELAQVVRTIAKDKHVYAFTAGQCCSAAYWVASQADVIYAAPSATVGSIGVILPVVDSSALYDRCGLKMEVFSAGKYKSTGMDGTSLTEEQRDRLTQQVNATWARFKQAVTRRRSISEDDMEGQTFYGLEARDRHLIDACAPSLDGVKKKLIQRHYFSK
nr:MAG TPA: hypothetical protein [Caudoviricetes sp.]